MCILLVFLKYVHHDVRFRECKVRFGLYVMWGFLILSFRCLPRIKGSVQVRDNVK